MISRGGGLALLVAASLGWAAPVVGEPGTGLQVLVVSTQHWVGRNDLLVEVLDRDGRALAPDRTPVTIGLTGPAGERQVGLVPVIARFAVSGRDLYRLRVPLGTPGAWRVEAAAGLEGMEVTGFGTFEVLPDDGTPPLGSRVPGGATPTLVDARNLMAAISSDPEPVSAFYATSVDRALADGQPFVFVLDSYAFRPNEACGGSLGIVHDIYIEYPSLTVIHAEPWRTTMVEGRLTIDPPGGPAQLNDWSNAWGVEEPPWVFVVDEDGHLVAKFTGVMGTDELRAAMGSVAEWRPPS
jgi:hypothetical protein